MLVSNELQGFEQQQFLVLKQCLEEVLNPLMPAVNAEVRNGLRPDQLPVNLWRQALEHCRNISRRHMRIKLFDDLTHASSSINLVRCKG